MEHPRVQGALEPHGFRDNTYRVSVSLLPVGSAWGQQETRAEMLKIILGCHSWHLQSQEFLPRPLGRALAEPTALCLCREGSSDSRTPRRERGAGNWLTALVKDRSRLDTCN